MTRSSQKNAGKQEVSLVRLSPVPSPETALAIKTDELLGSKRLDRHPVSIYITGLASGSRRTMKNALEKAVSIFTVGKSRDVMTFPWHVIRFQHVEALRAVLVDSKNKIALGTANKILSGVRRVLYYCFNLKLMPHEEYTRTLSGAKKIRGDREELVKGRMLTRQELDLIYAATDPVGIIGKRDRAALSLLRFEGLRRFELAAMTMAEWDRSDPDRQKLRFIGKGNKQRTVPIPQSALRHLEEWLAVRGTHDGPIIHPITPHGHINTTKGMSTDAVYSRLRELCKRAGVKNVGPHDFRRTYISKLFDKGADISTIASMVGHAQVETTRKYDRRNDDVKHRAAEMLDDWGD